jgi:hypothetical protein
VGPRVGLDGVEKRKVFTLPGLELQLLGRPARSQALPKRYQTQHLWIYSVTVFFQTNYTESETGVRILFQICAAPPHFT